MKQSNTGRHIYKQGYARGYAAGRRWAEQKLEANNAVTNKSTEWHKCFRSILPIVMQSNWQISDEEVAQAYRHVKQAMQITDDVMSKVREPSDDKQQ